MRRIIAILAVLVVASAARAARLPADDPAALTQEEEDRIRDAQDPSDRIAVYVELAEERLQRFNAIRQAAPDPSDPTNRSAVLDQLLSQYIALDDELKNWIEDQYDTAHDMRKGLRALIDVAPKQLAELSQAEKTPDRYQEEYRGSLHDAIADLNDTLNGATQALANQEKTLGALKRQEVAEAKAAKESAQDEKKREKEERKLRKKEQKQGVPEDEDQQN